MANLEFDSSWASVTDHPFEDNFNVGVEESSLVTPADLLDVQESPPTSLFHNSTIPKPLPVPSVSCVRFNFSKRVPVYSFVPKETKDAWNKLFEECYQSDAKILTDDRTVIYAHSFVLGIASPVLRSSLELAKSKDGFRYIKIPGVPTDAVRAFNRFLYSSSYDLGEMKKFVPHLLVLSHTFSVSALKNVSVNSLEQIYLTSENVIDVLQLAKQCDAPRLSLFCIRMVVKNFKAVSTCEGWKVTRRADPRLERELLECLVEADSALQVKNEESVQER